MPAVEILHAGGEEAPAVFEGGPGEVGDAALAGQDGAVPEDEIVEARVPILPEEEVAQSGGGGHGAECSLESESGNAGPNRRPREGGKFGP
jgi:hypothetical protein